MPNTELYPSYKMTTERIMKNPAMYKKNVEEHERIKKRGIKNEKGTNTG